MLASTIINIIKKGDINGSCDILELSGLLTMFRN